MKIVVDNTLHCANLFMQSIGDDMQDQLVMFDNRMISVLEYAGILRDNGADDNEIFTKIGFKRGYLPEPQIIEAPEIPVLIQRFKKGD